MNIVKDRFENGELIIALSGQIDSANSAEVGQQMKDACDRYPDVPVVIDCSALEYISSAGLRLITHLKKQHKELRIEEVSRDIYDIFEVTGFTKMIDIRKAMRRVSVEGLDVIGRGGNGTVYRLDRDTIIKAYTERTPLSDIQRERNYAQEAFTHGVPTAISYDIVRCGESYGTVFELIAADTLSRRLLAEPEKLGVYAERYGEFLKEVHSVEIEGVTLPTTKSIYFGWIDEMAGYYTVEEVDKLRRLVDWLPDRQNVIHGDYHVNNVMLQNDEFLLIDMETISVGHPLFDLGGMYISHIMTGQAAPELTVRFLGIDAQMAAALWNRFIQVYLGTTDPDQIKAVEGQAAVIALLKGALGPAVSKNEAGNAQMCVTIARQRLLPMIDDFIKRSPVI